MKTMENYLKWKKQNPYKGKKVSVLCDAWSAPEGMGADDLWIDQVLGFFGAEPEVISSINGAENGRTYYPSMASEVRIQPMEHSDVVLVVPGQLPHTDNLEKTVQSMVKTLAWHAPRAQVFFVKVPDNPVWNQAAEAMNVQTIDATDGGFAAGKELDAAAEEELAALIIRGLDEPAYSRFINPEDGKPVVKPHEAAAVEKPAPAKAAEPAPAKEPALEETQVLRPERKVLRREKPVFFTEPEPEAEDYNGAQTELLRMTPKEKPVFSRSRRAKNTEAPAEEVKPAQPETPKQPEALQEPLADEKPAPEKKSEQADADSRLRLYSFSQKKDYVFAKSNVQAGRLKSGNDLILSNPKVSRVHARFMFRDGEWLLEDLGSANGSSINTEKLEAGKRYPLRNGDLILLAGEKLRFQANF